MASKTARAKRLLALHKLLHQHELGRLAQAEALVRELKEEEMRLVRLLDVDQGLTVNFPELVLRRLRMAAQQQLAAARAAKAQAEVAREQARRLKGAEKLAAKAVTADEREADREELREIIDLVSKKVSVP